MPSHQSSVVKIKEHLKTLKMPHMLKTFESHLSAALADKRSHSEFLEKLLEEDANAAIQRRIERRIKESRLPDRKLLQDYDFDFQTGVDKTQIMELASLSFVDRKQGVILGGESGTGKSHIAKALLLIGCRQCRTCRYTTASDMLKDLISGLADDTLNKKLKRYINPELLLIDEIGFDRLEQETARNASLFFKVIDGRYGKASTMVTTNIDFKELGDYLGDPVITASIVDRMVHHSVIINIEGPSWRMFESNKINRKPVKKRAAKPAKKK